MKTSRLMMGVALAGLLASCASFTLVNANFDAASFIPSTQKTGTLAVTGVTPTLQFVPQDDSNINNGYLVNGLPTLGFVESFKIQIKVGLASQASSAATINGSLEVYLAPTTEQNIFQAQYLISSGNPVSLAPGSSSALDLTVTLGKTATGAQANALTEVKKGTFRFGAQLRLESTGGGSIDYTVDTAKLSVSGYPVNAFAKQ